MKAAVKTDDFELAGLPLHDSKCGLDGLTSCGEEETLIKEAGQNGDEFLRGDHARFVQALIIVQELAGGRLHGLDQVGMAVPHIGDQHAGGPVDERVAVGVGHDHAGSMVPSHLRLVARALCLDARPAREELLRAWTGQRPFYGCDFVTHRAPLTLAAIAECNQCKSRCHCHPEPLACHSERSEESAVCSLRVNCAKDL